MLFLATAAALLSVACQRHHRAAPGPAPVPAEVKARSRMKNSVFSADGMCSDSVVRHYQTQMRLRGPLLRTMKGRVKTLKDARARVKYSNYFPNRKMEEQAADRLKLTYAFWRDIYLPFHKRYGTFWCVRREDMAVLSSADIERGFDTYWDAVVQHLGPLNPPQNFELGD